MLKKMILAALICANVFSTNVFAIRFTDMENHPNKGIAEDLAERDIIEGTSENTYSPYDNVTRAEFCAMIVRGMNYQTLPYGGMFSDVDEDAWYAEYVEAIAEKKIINGYAGEFRPDDGITNEEAAKILVSLYEHECGRIRYHGAYASFMPDFFEISVWARDYVHKAVMIGAVPTLLIEKDFSKANPYEWTENIPYRPKDELLRGECAELIYNTLDSIEKTNM